MKLQDSTPAIDNPTLREWAQELGFQALAVTDTHIDEHAAHLRDWLAKGFHGEMGYMAGREPLRGNPADLVPDTVRVISLRMDYLPPQDKMQETLLASDRAYISRYALGRDYHKLIRKRLSQLAKRIEQQCGGHFRAFVDSAPVLERGFAEKAGLGWIGKNTMLINDKAGSWFFLGEIYTDLPLQTDPPQTTMHCGSCTACLEDCPTGAIVAPFQVDARKCISYLTIELDGRIPEQYRAQMGNRVFGCDDCQLVCPWNKFAETTAEDDFKPRHQLDDSSLVELFLWDEQTWLKNTEGSAIRRIGYENWLRNLAVGLGNSGDKAHAKTALLKRREQVSEMVREHIDWALARHAD